MQPYNLVFRHFGVNTNVTFTTSHFDQVISLPHYMSTDNGMYSTGEEMSHRVLQTFEDLNKQLRNLSQLPLAVTSVVGTSPVFRHTEVCCGSNSPYMYYVKCFRCFLLFHGMVDSDHISFLSVKMIAFSHSAYIPTLIMPHLLMSIP